MTQKEKIRKSLMFANRVKALAESMLHEGNDYDMQWHKSYCKQLREASESILKELYS